MSSYFFNDLLSEPDLRHGTSSRDNVIPSSISDSRVLTKEQKQTRNDESHHRLLTSCGMEKQSLKVLKQIHSAQVYVVDTKPLPERLEGDALITATPDQPIGIYTADCVPAILYDPVTHTAGVVHAGRAGTEKGIVPAVIKKMVDCFGVNTATLKVALGPSIGPCCYEVEEGCLAAMKDRFANWQDWVKEHTPGKVLLNLWKANQDQAVDSGVAASRVYLSGECTACHTDRWYSYRKEGDRAGRMLTVAMLCRR
ncbi:MAG: peptidoglycan editing factor PgeF [Candidatus Nitronauta litoralis]|uniref:Purine nucleoside phosphorylase n=1 Tax=Candidatus Nitronauta litoralis TaxID=2705533 RepID=A0A7T0BVN5_9BACT|nr:MAG: peptidoglycan editing factor PgeF [Candidatus Nitronauta litoralis]